MRSVNERGARACGLWRVVGVMAVMVLVAPGAMGQGGGGGDAAGSRPMPTPRYASSQQEAEFLQKYEAEKQAARSDFVGSMAGRTVPGQGAPHDPVVTIDFAGGSAIEYLKTIERAAGRSIAVAMPGVENYTVPAVTLTEVSLDGAIQILNAVGYWEDGFPNTLMTTRRGDVYIVQPDRTRLRSPPQTVVWSLQEYMGSGLASQEILGAVETALSIFSDPATVKYHEETGLLIMRGPQSQVEAVSSVLSGVASTAASRHQLQGWIESDRERVRILRMKHREGEIELRRYQIILEQAESDQRGVERGVEQGIHGPELAEEWSRKTELARLDVARAQAQLEDREQALHEAELRLRALEAGL